jgi:hypothetical protein
MTNSIDELPSRREHLRKVAERLTRDTPEYAADDPKRTVQGAGGGHRANSPASGAVARGPRG